MSDTTTGGSTLPRVAYLTGEFPRATDTFIQREVTALRTHGFDVHTFAIRRPGTAHDVGPERKALEASTTYVLESLRSGFLSAVVWAVTRSPRRLAEAIRLAWRTRRPGVRGTTYQIMYLFEAIVLGHDLRRRDVDHLHNHLGDSSCTVAMLASEVSGVPFSFTLHGPGIFFEPHTWQIGTKLDRSAFCATISHFARSQAAIFASPESLEKVHIVHCGVDPGRLSPVDHVDVGHNLIFVGRLVELKGLSVLLESVANLAIDRPDLTLTVVGDGPDRAVLEKKAKALGLGSAVTFVGSKSQDEVGRLLAKSDVFVLPSFAEGVPVVLMEAMGSAVPVVSTFVGGIPELVEDGINGFLVPPSDLELLTQRLAQLLDSPELRTQMGSAGRTKVLTHFDSAIEARRLGYLFASSGRGLANPVRPLPLDAGQPTDDTNNEE